MLGAYDSNFSVQGKKGVWLKLPLDRSEFIPLAVKVRVTKSKYQTVKAKLFLRLIVCLTQHFDQKRVPISLL